MSQSLTASNSLVTDRPVGEVALRQDIQALRAIAVSMVVVYHFWPSLLPGGFVGVDVFFVISGFLITSHLYRHPPIDLKSLTSFWARRVLRLIPAAAAAILGTLLLVLLVLSEAEWSAAAKHAATSMVYVENWLLIREATDYLGAEANPSPFQHFWSLSVEEQFYLLWPFVIGAAMILTRQRRAARRRTVMSIIAITTLASFVYSLSLTWTNPPMAYFASPARFWELTIGGLLAVAVMGDRSSTSTTPTVPRPLGPLARTVILWAALVTLIGCCFLISGSTPFPGVSALAPTLATVAFILAADPAGRWTPRRLMHARPVQFVGDVSYAAYLWHWPLVTLVPLAVTTRTDAIPEWAVTFALLPVLVLLAWLSTTFLEAPLRRVPAGHSGRRRALITVLVSTLLVLGAAAAVAAVVEQRSDAVEDRVSAVMAGLRTPCVGAAAMEPEADCPEDATLLTTPDFARSDIPSSIRVGECLNWPPFDELVSCSFGNTETPTRRIALFGNSHAGHWQPALEGIAEARGWRVDTFVIGVCQPTLEPIPYPEPISGVPPEVLAQTCDTVVREALRRIVEDGYDVAVMSTLDHVAEHAEPDTNVYSSTLDLIAQAGIPVLVLRDTPASLDQSNDTPTCLGLNPDDPAECAGRPEDWIRQDPLTAAATSSDSPLVHRLDLNDYLCGPSTCEPIIGGVITYADYNHMSSTFARTLAPYLEPGMLEAMGTVPPIG